MISNVNKLPAKGQTLYARTEVTTGAAIDTVVCRPDDTLVAKFQPTGNTEVNFKLWGSEICRVSMMKLPVRSQNSRP